VALLATISAAMRWRSSRFLGRTVVVGLIVGIAAIGVEPSSVALRRT
jgi:hypothetical protein